jgi:hypothetical protein
MKPLYCAACDAPHDVALEPDLGVCVICGGKLIEDESERAEATSGAKFAQAIVDTVNDGLAKVALVRGKAPRGVN